MAYVYLHKRADTGEIFYVGIGSQPNHSRAYFKSNRSLHWKRIVAKYSLLVEIFKDNITWEEAKAIEIELIAKYGRKDKKTGPLINRTDGGDGTVGQIFSAESLQKRSAKLRGRTISDEARKNMSLARIGRKIGPHQAETRKKMSDAAKGRRMGLETKAKLSLANKGKKLSSETRRRIGLASKGKFVSIETRQKLRLANIGKSVPKTEEQKQFMRLKMKGRIFSEEWKSNIRSAAVGRKMPTPTEEHRRKIAESLKGRKHSPEAIERMKAAAKNRKPEHYVRRHS